MSFLVLSRKKNHPGKYHGGWLIENMNKSAPFGVEKKKSALYKLSCLISSVNQSILQSAAYFCKK